MVGHKIALDTNAYSVIIRDDMRVVNAISDANEVFIPIFVSAELLYGFKKGIKAKENLDGFNRFLQLPKVSVLHTTWETAELFADIKLELQTKGRPIPTNDIWIAALAIESGSVLVTFDKHFQYIPGLRLAF